MKTKPVKLSKRLEKYFIIFVLLQIAHGLEEYFTGFYDKNPISKFIFQYFETMSTYQQTFLLFQIMIWVLLIISFLLIFESKWDIYLLIIPALIMIFELHHVIEAIMIRGYYPGLITSLPFPVLGFLWGKELLRLKKRRN